MGAHNELGKVGEEEAVKYLELQGYRIRHRNWRSKRYELDIVAVKDGILVFIEVKTRRNNLYGEPENAVNRHKIWHLVSCADTYVKCYHLDMPSRFDVISLVGTKPPFKINHIENAFQIPWRTY